MRRLMILALCLAAPLAACDSADARPSLDRGLMETVGRSYDDARFAVSLRGVDEAKLAKFDADRDREITAMRVAYSRSDGPAYIKGSLGVTSATMGVLSLADSK